MIEEIRSLARKYGVDKVILFGSRARGDYGRASDIDLAVTGGGFTRFCVDVKETTSTLLDFDIVDLEQLKGGKFLEAIRQEGIVIYEKV